MTNKNLPLGMYIPVLSGPGEDNYKKLMVFSPVIPRTGVRFLVGFPHGYTPMPPPEPPTGGGSPNVVSLSKERNKRAQVASYTANNAMPFRKAI